MLDVRFRFLYFIKKDVSELQFQVGEQLEHLHRNTLDVAATTSG
jgi:hypothetical protein